MAAAKGLAIMAATCVAQPMTQGPWAPLAGAAAQATAQWTPASSSPPGAPGAQLPGAKPVAQASLEQMLQAAPSVDWQWWRYKANDAVLVIEFPNLWEQGMAMNRLAAMFEKRGGRRDRLLTDTEMAQLLRRSGDSVGSYYQGHDYPAVELAHFFSLAARQAARLNAQEERLRELLIDAAVMQPAPGGGFTALGVQAVISFTAIEAGNPSTPLNEQVDSLRRETVLRHELSHGEFFTNPAYRDYCVGFWQRDLSAAQRRIFRRYLESIGYDPSDEALMANETQAFLMHTPDARAFNAAALGMSEKALDALRMRFRAHEPERGLAARAADSGRR
jgi:hypothetical protein